MAKKLYLVIEYGNGIKGQYKFTDYDVGNIKEALKIVKKRKLTSQFKYISC